MIEVTYNHSVLSLNKRNASILSPKLKLILDSNPETIKITGKYPVTAFSTFIGILNGLPYELTSDNISELRELSQEYEVSQLLEKIEEDMVNIIPYDDVLNLIIDLIDKKQPFNEYEEIIASNVSRLFENPLVQRLPFDSLVRIFEKSNLNEIDQTKVFEFIISYSRMHKVDVSLLVKFLDFSQLSISQVMEIMSIRGLNKKNLVRNVQSFLCILLQSIDTKKNEIETTRLRGEKEIEMLESQRERIIQENITLQNEIDEIKNKINEDKKKQSQFKVHNNDQEKPYHGYKKQNPIPYPIHDIPEPPKEHKIVIEKPARFIISSSVTKN